MRISDKLIDRIISLETGPVRIMEVCGTHTMTIAKAGIKRMLPENVKLISGPGCPVCVTPEAVMDAVLRLSSRCDVIISSYGDMMRVPGSSRGDNLALRRAKGARVEMVFSPMDAIELAIANPDKELVFLGAGFETTAPGTAAAIVSASERGLKNFSVLSILKMLEPALRALIAEPGFKINAFLCPGHVGTIIGLKGFEYLAKDYRLPGVVAGFEPEDILLAVYMLLKQISEGRAEVENGYRRAVSFEGNIMAAEMMRRVLEPAGSLWRGLGFIENSGLGIKEEFADFDAVKRFGIELEEGAANPACRCGDVICGRLEPDECPLFGGLCTPEDPVGPCMVSSEGACAAAYKYSNF
ncbi:MAG TPA: hydrogenase formation protein HypD [Bacillota bacterium]|nr:hydrogenase formation protein HypD [Bacillota bacterium]HQC35962.1 hydrogenase formation protein HypD [Bacillota bacterium]